MTSNILNVSILLYMQRTQELSEMNANVPTKNETAAIAIRAIHYIQPTLGEYYREDYTIKVYMNRQTTKAEGGST